MALIEIDLEPFVDDSPAQWKVRINTTEKLGIPDVQHNNVETFAQVLLLLHAWMNGKAYL